MAQPGVCHRRLARGEGREQGCSRRYSVKTVLDCLCVLEATARTADSHRTYCWREPLRPIWGLSAGSRAAMSDSSFAWSGFILLDLAPCSGLGRSHSDPDSLPRPRPPCLPTPGLPQFPSARPPPSPSAARTSPGDVAARGDPDTLAWTSSQPGHVAKWLRAGLESWLATDLLGSLGYVMTPSPVPQFPDLYK